MTSMIEKVEEALEYEFNGWGRVFDKGQKEGLAKAVIKAMMEPSEAMIEAGHEAYHPSPDYGLDDEDLGLAYKAMINAALEEE